MPSDELIFEPSMPSSTRSSSIFSYNSSNTDIESSADTFDNAEDELINRPTTFPAQPPPETTQETFLCQQLALAVILLRKLRRFLVLDPSKLFEKSTTQRACNVIKEGNIDAIFAVDTDKIVVLGPEVLGDLHQVSRACSIRDRIFGDVELLKIMENLRMDCRDSGRVQLLLTTLRYTAAFVYLAFLQTLDCGGFVEREKLDEFRPLGLFRQQSPKGSITKQNLMVIVEAFIASSLFLRPAISPRGASDA
ncbi:hypothetical protein FOVG_18338 [Fusarium oxysporum f. sp. pisi HDV247]|uniref:Uncharacterized protein n=1 Tax=Fusarium oxysporum f. sp. pisi HDV247 TaxID=1080344 RepID=W9NHN5_FUSOX|nr:hypothetical protein FOVG_18338 [Fusarium oxysporum f. sp. pisi HDV247]